VVPAKDAATLLCCNAGMSLHSIEAAPMKAKHQTAPLMTAKADVCCTGSGSTSEAALERAVGIEDNKIAS